MISIYFITHSLLLLHNVIIIFLNFFFLLGSAVSPGGHRIHRHQLIAYYGMKILVNDSSTNDDKYENDIDNDDELIN